MFVAHLSCNEESKREEKERNTCRGQSGTFIMLKHFTRLFGGFEYRFLTVDHHLPFVESSVHCEERRRERLERSAEGAEANSKRVETQVVPEIDLQLSTCGRNRTDQ